VPVRIGLVAALVLGAATSTFATRHDSAARFFDSQAVIRVQLAARFNDLFAHAFDEDGYSVDGTMTYSGPLGTVELTGVKIAVRGHSSETECGFPKLKITFSRGPDLDASVFRGLNGLKIGTHCGERADSDVTKLGRLANEKSPLREALVYRLLDTMGVPTLKARPGRITYVYSDPRTDRTPNQQQPLERNAIFVEDDEAAMTRLGADGEFHGFTDGRRDFPADDALTLAFGEALIGNFDWCLKFTPDDPHHCDAKQLLYNVLAFKRPDGRAFPVMYDFDLAGMVVGRHIWFNDTYNAAFVASRSPAEIETLSQVQRMRALFGRDELDAVRDRFKRRKHDAYRVVADAVVDPAGRSITRSYVDGFFRAIDDDHAFYRPVVIRRDVYAYLDPHAREAACQSQALVPMGTPVSEPRQRSGAMVYVDVLDTQWHWAWQCSRIRTGPVWIDRRAIGTKYPPRRARR
jgi:hypothetical protein